MKKNIVFVIPSLEAGGGEKSLVNLLSQLDFNKYNVDLFLFNKTGVFLSSIPKEVILLDYSDDYKLFTKPLHKAVIQFLKKGKLSLIYARFLFSLRNKFVKDTAIREQYNWSYVKKSIDILPKQYDIAISYLEKTSIYFAVDKIDAKKKIGWIHTNYENSGMDHKFDYPYFKKLDNIVTVSEECVKSLKQSFPMFEEKIYLIYNIVSPKLINQLADEPIDSIIEDLSINLLTIARLSKEKGIDLAIKTCKILIQRGYKIRWYVIGEGIERESLEKLIIENSLQPYFKLLGIRANPYPYVKKATIYVQPSRYEGKSIAIDEAKILRKPIVVTNFETAKDQICDEIDGLIVEMNEQGLANGIERLIKDKSLQQILIENLSNQRLGTEEEIHKLYRLIEGDKDEKKHLICHE